MKFISDNYIRDSLNTTKVFTIYKKFFLVKAFGNLLNKDTFIEDKLKPNFKLRSVM